MYLKLLIGILGTKKLLRKYNFLIIFRLLGLDN